MKKKLLGLAVLLLAVMTTSQKLEAVEGRTKEATQIKMRSITFDPKQLVVAQGTEIVWNNVSLTDHSATSDSGTFDTGMVPPGKSSKPVLFDKEGEFKYHCQVHGKTMSATVLVKAITKK